MSTAELMSLLELGLLYGIMTMGIYISYRILNVPDLTVDGSFTLGAAISVVVSMTGHPLLGILLGALGGACAGITTAFLQTKLKIQPILAGILTMTALYTVNIWVMGGKANVALGTMPTVFTTVADVIGNRMAKVVVPFIIVILLVGVFTFFLHTRLGLSIRATGDNEAMVRSSSINVDFTKTVGLALANMLVGLSGAMLGQTQGFADANMGVGMVIMGLASLIIGEVIFCNIYEMIFKTRPIFIALIGVLIGSIGYRAVILAALKLNLSASSMKLISAIIITLAISYPVIKAKFKLGQRKKAHAKERGVHHA
ncbi:MAG: ABC transporter permease [Cellulosilyticaceae bacterium]